MFYASERTDFDGQLFDNGALSVRLSTDGTGFYWIKLDDANAQDAYAKLAEVQGQNAANQQAQDERAELEAAHPEVDFSTMDRAVQKLANHADARELADSSPFPYIAAAAYWYYDMCNPDERAVYDALVAIHRLPDLENVCADAVISFCSQTDEGRKDPPASSRSASATISAPAPVVELAIHDALMDLVSYDNRGVTNQASFESGAGDDLQDAWLQHNAYDALVHGANNTPNCVVCEGYAQAFQLLPQMAGVEAVTVSGLAGPADGAWGHVWTPVCLDGEWYEVDPTWDDDVDHWYFNLTTEAMAYDAQTNSIHMRSGVFENDAYTVDLGGPETDLAPVAYGTAYTYEAILAM